MAKLRDHTSRAHALLSASAASRWMHCTPSAVYTKDLPDETSPYAEEGTKAHEIAEACLRAYLDGKTEPDFGEDQRSIYDQVHPYVDHCIESFTELNKKYKDAVMFIETKVDFSKWVPDGFGTADCIIIAGNELHVRDLKFGKGVPVYAHNNPQARCYGLGALAMFDDLYDIETIHNEIDQVRLDNGLSEEVISKEELLKWADEALKPKAELAAKGEGEFSAGDWCRFCKAKGQCPYRAKADFEVEEIREEKKPLELLTDDQISTILSKKDDLTKFLKDVEAFAVDKVVNKGETIPGWKVVEGRSVRVYTDEHKVAEAVKNAGYDEALIYNRKLIGITDMTKLLGGKKNFEKILDGLVVKPEGKPTLVPESDKRKPMKLKTAEEDFETEEK